MIVLELPCYKATSGGITRTIELARRMRDKYDVQLRFQRQADTIPDLGVPYTVGPPDATFPACDYCITYSDTPYSYELSGLVQVNRVFVYMLSYGMAIVRERQNILNPGLVVMSSTERTRKLIEAEGVKCHNVGFGEINFSSSTLSAIGTVINNIPRKRYAALLFHPVPNKKYELGVQVCNELHKQGLIDGVLTFGMDCLHYQGFSHPTALVQHFPNATRMEVSNIFSQCSVFIMPSVTEGLNMTPIESTLCGCPAVICDGAIDEIFINGATCFIAEKNNFENTLAYAKVILEGNFSNNFYENMKAILSRFTWGKTIANIEKVMGL